METESEAPTQLDLLLKGGKQVEHWEKVEAVQRMQDYLRIHASGEQFDWKGFWKMCIRDRHKASGAGHHNGSGL